MKVLFLRDNALTKSTIKRKNLRTKVLRFLFVVLDWNSNHRDRQGSRDTLTQILRELKD